MLMMPLITSGLNSLHKNLYAHGNAANNTLIQVASSIGTSIIITLMSKVSTSSRYTYTAKTQVHGINVLFFAKKGLYTNYLVQQPHLQLLTRKIPFLFYLLLKLLQPFYQIIEPL